jgi:hypothetical protein
MRSEDTTTLRKMTTVMMGTATMMATAEETAMAGITEAVVITGTEAVTEADKVVAMAAQETPTSHAQSANRNAVPSMSSTSWVSNAAPVSCPLPSSLMTSQALLLTVASSTATESFSSAAKFEAVCAKTGKKPHCCTASLVSCPDSVSVCLKIPIRTQRAKSLETDIIEARPGLGLHRAEALGLSRSASPKNRMFPE